MAYKTSYELHHNFPKLAEEAGFAFNTHRPRVHIDWNKIRLLDIEGLIRDRTFTLVEQHVNDIQDCVLESEFDVRILDEGVLKMFRLAQLTVEYQQFCRHYLDRSVYVLKEEIARLVQELGIIKKNLLEKDEELRKIRKKTKYTHRSQLPYGNENIATMILKTLANKNETLPSSSNGDVLHYNKCNFCDKVFLNQLYLKSHISRRHTNFTDIPQKDVTENINIVSSKDDNTKLNQEIAELRSKLTEMEDIIKNAKSEDNLVKNNEPKVSTKEMKDAEVSTNNENFLLDKIEEWKREEREQYSKEINLLRNQLIETINLFKDKEKTPAQNDLNTDVIEQLHKTIQEQDKVIFILKEELQQSKTKNQNDEEVRKRKTEEQMTLWSKRAELQNKQYETLLQKLNEVAREAQESRAVAEAERKRAESLQNVLQQNLINHQNNNADKSEPVKSPVHGIKDLRNNSKARKDNNESVDNMSTSRHKNSQTNHKSLEELHRKAQELLNIGSFSSSDVSSSSVDEETTQNKSSKNIKGDKSNMKINYVDNREIEKIYELDPIAKKKENLANHLKSTKRKDPRENAANKKNKAKKDKTKSYPDIKQNGPIVPTGSPKKLIRAKITEDVNKRLASLGVDPLKISLSRTIFQKQRAQLQQQRDLKSKKNISHDTVRHCILTYLDSNTKNTQNISYTKDYISTDKTSKPFSITSVISNVKNKALSFVKSNDIITSKNERKTLNAEVAKKAMALLKTPPGSAPSSPVKSKLNQEKLNFTSSTKSTHNIEMNIISDKSYKKKTPIKSEITKHDSSSDDSNESDHKYYDTTVVHQTSNAIEHLIKSPARRPSSMNTDYNHVRRYVINNDDQLKNSIQTKSENDIPESNPNTNLINEDSFKNTGNNSDDIESLSISPIKKATSEEYIQNSQKQTKSVLKNASSTSSLSKKKVLFDMDAIQMKSVSASPSLSTTEKSDGNEKYELGLINLDDEEWDISSIENEPLKNDTKLKVMSRTSPKIAELKQTIESQLARRNEIPSSAIVGGIDVLQGQMVKGASIGGSNTSLGSSILDDSDDMPIRNNKALVKSKTVTEKNDSELDISEFSIDGIVTNRKDDNF